MFAKGATEAESSESLSCERPKLNSEESKGLISVYVFVIARAFYPVLLFVSKKTSIHHHPI